MSLVDEVRQAKKLPAPDMARLIRINAGVSQGRMAQEINVHRMTIARWESGARRPRGTARARYAALLEQLLEAAA